MAIKRDYECREHGYFEAWEPVCPEGCKRGIKVVFLRAPAYVSARTKSADQTVRGLAENFNMTNIKSTREGETQAGYFTRNNAPEPQQQPTQSQNGVLWGNAGRFSMQNVLANGAAQSVRGEAVGFNPKDMGNLQGPKTASYLNDHEGLKIK